VFALNVIFYYRTNESTSTNDSDSGTPTILNFAVTTMSPFGQQRFTLFYDGKIRE